MDGAAKAVAFSSEVPIYTFPRDTFESGKTYGLIIEAQYIGGDPFLRDEDYYAFSYSESPEYYFSTE